MSKTLAELFCADPAAMCFEPPYNAVQNYGEDSGAELQFPDGSIASQDGGGWEVGPLSAPSRADEFIIGGAILTDYGSAIVAAFREDEAGQLEVGFMMDGQLAWASTDYVRKL